MPTYHLANVVDDHLMEITHVIRGEEWLPSLALHVLLYKAFGWDSPLFAHLPLILKPSGKGKLSKRDGDKFGFPVYALDWVEEKTYTGFSEAGFLPEALVNYMAFLGWSPNDEKELYSVDELIKDFSLEKINKSGGKFDPKKLLWLNSQHIQQLDKQALSEICLLKNKDIDSSRMEGFIGLIQSRMDSIVGLKNQFLYLFKRPDIDAALIQKMKSPETLNALNEFTEALVSEKPIDAAKTKNILYGCAEKHGAKFGKVMGFCRASIVGKMEGPDVIQMMFFIGLEETLIRLKESLNC
jgi:glutamyl-tRNA synthetase